MSFREALSNFINGYEEKEGVTETPIDEPVKPTEPLKPEEAEKIEAAKEERELKEAEEARIDSLATGTDLDDQMDQIDPTPEGERDPETIDRTVEAVPAKNGMLEGTIDETTGKIIFKLLPDHVKETLTEERKAELLKLTAGDFHDTIENLLETTPKPSGRIANAMKADKAEPEEDWTLALFQD